MAKTFTVAVQRNTAKQQLFGARQALAHLVEMYDKDMAPPLQGGRICRGGPPGEARRRTLDGGREQVRPRTSAGSVNPLRT